MTPKTLTRCLRGDIINITNCYKKIEKTKFEIETYLARLKYALNQKDTMISFQESRRVDKERDPKYTNTYTMAELFPDESPKEVLSRELQQLSVDEYIETVKDTRYPKLSDFWVFGKIYDSKEVYIKFRVEIVGRNHVFVMSFHFSTIPFEKDMFPFANS